MAMTVGIAACRAIVGIDDLELVAPSTGMDASSDVQAAPDAGAPDGDLAEACRQEGRECRRCCKQAFPALATFERQVIPTCMCRPDGGGVCQSQCSTAGDPCSSTPSGGPPSTNCTPCLDDALIASRCPGCDSSECMAGRACLESCD